MSKITLVEYSEKNNLKFDSVLEFINTNLAEGKSLLAFEELYSIESSSISPYFKKKKYKQINNQYQNTREEVFDPETVVTNAKLLKYFVTLFTDQIINNQTPILTTYSSVKLSDKNLAKVHQLTKGKMITFSFIVNTLLDRMDQLVH